MSVPTWLTRLVLTSVAAFGVLTAFAVAPAQAVDGLAVTSHSTYLVDAAGAVVHATETVTLTHHLPDRPVDGGVQYSYLEVIALPVAASASNVRASSGARTLAVTTEPTPDPSTVQAVVSLPRQLRYGDTLTVELTFDLTGAPPRSADRTRVGADFATFGVYAVGDQGMTTVEIVVPNGWTSDATTDGFTESIVEGRRTLTTTTNTDVDGIFALVSLRNPQTPVTPLTVGPAEFAISPWPGDSEWADFVTDGMTRGLPVLEKAVGLAWPIEGTTTIREDAAPGVRGFDGWFDPKARQVALSEGLDPVVLYHELGHAWASGDTYSARWLREGVAEYLARRTIDELGVTADPPIVVTGDDPDAVPLNAWEESPVGRASATDGYAYPASRQVMEQVFSGLTTEQVTAVLRSATQGESAYDPAGATTSLTVDSINWQRFLDLVDIRGGQAQAPQVFSQWVLTTDQQAMLTDRATARTRYAALDAADGTWRPPLAVRAPMTRWEFAEAQTVMAGLEPAAAVAVEVQEAADSAGIGVPGAVQSLYESALTPSDLAALTPELQQSAVAVHDLGSAIQVWHSGNPAARVGATLLFVRSGIAAAATDLDEGRLDQGQREAASVASRARWALPLGLVGIALTVLLVAGVTVLIWRLARRPRRSVPPASTDGPPLPIAGVGGTLGPMTPRTTAELEAFLPTILASPRDVGTLDLIVRRPAIGEREVLDEGELHVAVGLVGDTWIERGSRRTDDGAAHPDMQLNIMNSRVVGFLAGDPSRRALAGDQLYLDLDLSHENLPSGTRLTFGEGVAGGIPAVVVVTDQPHTGCAKFVDRFGAEAMQFVNGGVGRPLRLRGLNARVVVPGVIRAGQRVHVTRPIDGSPS